MQPRPTASPSFLNAWQYCQQSTFLSYFLGYYDTPNIKTVMGTCTHRVLENLAKCKQHFQTGSKTYHLIDEEIGINIKVKSKDWMKIYELSQKEIDKINGSRLNKDIYKTPNLLMPGHIRYGVELVDYITEKCLDYFSNTSGHNWKPIDKSNVNNWVWMVLDYKNGLFDPRQRFVIATETKFSIELKEDWARLDDGYIKLTGVIDLVTQIGDNSYEIIDWKSGQRKDWATGEVKTFDKLQDDLQLLLYYYAAQHLYPNKHCIVSIFFIRDGGPYSPCFDDGHLSILLNNVKSTLNEIRACQQPKLLDTEHKDFRCNKLCSFYKKKVGKQCMCDFMYDRINEEGIEKVIEKYHSSKFQV